jgi:hypothetical protein
MHTMAGISKVFEDGTEGVKIPPNSPLAKEGENDFFLFQRGGIAWIINSTLYR